jgi:hypothetical protein
MVHRFLKSQMKNKTKRDWVTSVHDDLEFLGLGDLDMEQIKNMKKVSFMKMVKENNDIKTFEKLQLRKKSHSKVEKIEHTHKNAKVSTTKPNQYKKRGSPAYF